MVGGTKGTSGMKFDDRTERNLKTLLPLVEQKARMFLVAASQELAPGWRIVVTSGTRTFQEQDLLFAQGRTRAGKIVTKARGGFSNHNFGVAFDIALINGSKAVFSGPMIRKLAPLAKALGFRWGGDWTTMKDEPHFEWPTGKTLAQMRALVLAGKSVL